MPDRLKKCLMKTSVTFALLRLLAGCARRSERPPESPFELSFRREPGMSNFGMLYPAVPGYDRQLPGYRILGVTNGIIQMILRPTSAEPPLALVLALQAGARKVNRSTGGTVVEPWANLRHRTELQLFSVRQGDTIIMNDLVRREDKLVIIEGPQDYFRYDIVGDAVHVTFLPKAMALLDRECRIIWAHSLDR